MYGCLRTGMFNYTGDVIKMFCLYCTEYQGLDNDCRKGKNIHNIKDVMECEDYKYNGDVNGEKV